MPTLQPEMIGAIISIVVIDLTLSGDNAVLNGMAAHRTPARQSRMGGGDSGSVHKVIQSTVIADLIIPRDNILGVAWFPRTTWDCYSLGWIFSLAIMVKKMRHTPPSSALPHDDHVRALNGSPSSRQS